MKAPGESAGISASALALLAPGWPHGLSCPLGHGGLSLCKIVLDPVDCLAGLTSSAGDGVSSDLLNPSPPRLAHERYADSVKVFYGTSADVITQSVSRRLARA